MIICAKPTAESATLHSNPSVKERLERSSTDVIHSSKNPSKTGWQIRVVDSRKAYQPDHKMSLLKVRKMARWSEGALRLHSISQFEHRVSITFLAVSLLGRGSKSSWFKAFLEPCSIIGSTKAKNALDTILAVSHGLRVAFSVLMRMRNDYVYGKWVQRGVLH